MASLDRSSSEDETLVLYLANDFHWRGARLINISGAGLAILRFRCKDKEVQLSRCVFVDAVQFDNRVDLMAQADDYTKRGLDLPLRVQNRSTQDEVGSLGI